MVGRGKVGDEYMVGNNEYMVGNNEYVGGDYTDAKYFDELLECMGELLVNGVEARGKRPDDNWGVTVSSLNLRSLLDYCAILRPLLDAVELGEVEQYKKGLEDGRKEGRAEVMEDLVKKLSEGHYHLYDYKEVADIFRLRWQGGGK